MEKRELETNLQTAQTLKPWVHERKRAWWKHTPQKGEGLRSGSTFLAFIQDNTSGVGVLAAKLPGQASFPILRPQGQDRITVNSWPPEG